MEWFRWYKGTAEDGKFRMAARHANVTLTSRCVTVCHAIGIWSVILEDASHPDHRGICLKDEDYISAILDLEAAIVQAVIEGMVRAGLISGDIGDITVTNWKKRQYEVDIKDPTASERQRRRREKLRENGRVTECHGDVTVMSLPDTDTDTDTDIKEEVGKPTSKKNDASHDPVKRGTRLPQGAILPDDYSDFAKKEGHSDPQREWAKFTDYWIAQPGQKGVKLDWFGTWRNWIRRSVENGKKPANGKSSRNSYNPEESRRRTMEARIISMGRGG